MCGLIGVAGNITVKMREVFRTLLVLDTLRGPHSTGMAAVKKDGSWDVLKKKGVPQELFDHRDYNVLVNGPSYVLIGHNRFATKGKINNTNAHPFEFENVVGAHNGTIRAQNRLVDSEKFEVDSENIFWSIEKEGLEDTLEELQGAYALSYWDKRSEELILLRNSERTLHYAYSDDLKTLFWASESWMISIACSRCGVKIGKIEEVKPLTIHRFTFDMQFNPENIELATQVFQEAVPINPPKPQGGAFPAYSAYGVPPNKGVVPAKKPLKEKEGGLPIDLCQKLLKTFVRFTVEGHKQTFNKQWFIHGKLNEFPEVECRIFAAPNTPLWNELTLQYDSDYEGEVASYSKVGDNVVVNLKLSTVQEVIDEDDDSDDVFLGYNNKLLTEEQFETSTHIGCAWCTNVPTKQQSGELLWLSYTTFLCSECQEQDDVIAHLSAAAK